MLAHPNPKDRGEYCLHNIVYNDDDDADDDIIKFTSVHNINRAHVSAQQQHAIKWEGKCISLSENKNKNM